MAYDKDKLYQKALKAVKDKNLYNVEQLIAYIPCSKPTFYDHFPIDSNEFNTLKEVMEDNKVRTKTEIREKLFKSDKAAELLALYRLLATPDEHRKLNQSYTDHTSNGKEITPPISWS